MRYAGSLLKYSFAEHDHDKSVSLVEIGAPGSADGDAGAAGRARVTVETVSLAPLRDVRIVEGTLDELIAAGRDDPRPDDYIQAVLHDTSALLDPLGRLREVYPNTLAHRAARPRAPAPPRASRPATSSSGARPSCSPTSSPS